MGETHNDVDQVVKRQILAALQNNQAASLTDATGSATAQPAPAPAKPPAKKRKFVTCSSGKGWFPSEDAARARLDQIHGTSHTGRGYGPVNVHYCRKCRGWHLTAKIMKQWKSGKPRR